MPRELFAGIDTPALVIDLDALDRNLDRMASFLSGGSCGLRPHFKSHRISGVTRRQHARGARGVTCAKLAEAEKLASLGFDDFLIANEVVGTLKWRRLAALAGTNRVMVGMDNLDVAQATAAAARSAGSEVGFLLDLNAGMDRCGVAPGPNAVDLACRMAELEGLKFHGVMSYEGHAVMMERSVKESTCREAMARVVETFEGCRSRGLGGDIVSAGGTGTWDVTGRCPGVTELQCGTYALMDLLFSESAQAPFEYACTVLATVISRPSSDRAVTDAGKKAIHPSFGFARPVDLPGATLESLHSEHGLLKVEDEARNLRPGDQVQFIPMYLEGTTNLFNTCYTVRNGEVVEQWAVDGQNCSR